MVNIKHTHLCIGDAHAQPEISNRRFDWLGELIADRVLSYPDEHLTIIDMGDWEDMPSLSSYDRGKLNFEGRRYFEDIEAGVDARKRTMAPLMKELSRIKNSKKRVPNNFNFIAIGGNHFEGRINRVLQDNSWLSGTLRVEHNQCADLGWDYHPFLAPVEIDGILYVHYWHSRGNRNSIGGGKYPAASILREKLCSTVTGHSHVLDRASIVDGRGKRIYSLVAGCYMDPDQYEDYAGQSNQQWWKGLCLLKDVKDGLPEGGEEFLPIEVVRNLYG